MDHYKNILIGLGVSVLTSCSNNSEKAFLVSPTVRVQNDISGHTDNNYQANIKNNAKRYSTYLVESDSEDDFIFVNETINLKKYRQLRRLGKEEWLAHKWVYNAILKSKEPIRFVDGCMYDIFPIEVERAGICAFILTGKSTPYMRVVFRGTKCSDSLFRDLECIPNGGAGAASYAEHKVSILNQIRDRLIAYQASQSSKNIILTISGHSLGGADVQYAIHSILEGMVKSPTEYASFFKLKRIDFYHFNSAGVPQSIIDECNTYVQKLHTAKWTVKLGAHSVLVDGDAIQCTGEGNILDEASRNMVKSTLYKFERERNHGFVHKVWNLSRAHREKLLIENNKQPGDACNILSNATSDHAQKITKELRTKSKFLQTITKAFQAVFWGGK